jgi:hypothetical protein
MLETPDSGLGDPGRPEETEEIGGGEEGARNADAAPAIDEGGEAGQTQAPAPDDDVGGAEDEPDRTE